MRPRSGRRASITSSARIRPTGRSSVVTTTTDMRRASIRRSATSSHGCVDAHGHRLGLAHQSASVGAARVDQQLQQGEVPDHPSLVVDQGHGVELLGAVLVHGQPGGQRRHRLDGLGHQEGRGHEPSGLVLGVAEQADQVGHLVRGPWPPAPRRARRWPGPGGRRRPRRAPWRPAAPPPGPARLRAAGRPVPRGPSPRGRRPPPRGSASRAASGARAASGPRAGRPARRGGGARGPRWWCAGAPRGRRPARSRRRAGWPPSR